MVLLEANPETITHFVKLTKDAGRQLNDDKMRAQVDQILSAANTPTRLQKGWRTELRVKDALLNRGWFDQNYGGSGYKYSVILDISIERPKRDPRMIEVEFQNIIVSLTSAGKSQPGKPWIVVEVDGEEPKAATLPASDGNRSNAEIGYAPIQIPENWPVFFSHLYGLDAHINRLRWALENAIDTNFESRVHTLFVGPPGCGKSDIGRSMKTALGEESVLEFDATSTTKAGAQGELAEREELPRVILIEEIEKCNPDSLRFLLSLLDIRAELRKTTKVERIERDVKLVAVATCNDYKLFQSMEAGALASRFGKPVYFRRPTPELLRRILRREVERHNGKMEWIEPTIQFALRMRTTDPREVIGHMMVGRDYLLTGEYQAAVEATSSPDDEWEALPAL